ncbi:MAG: class I SAM-dependent methyltransferase [Thermaurantimonas sp.]|uniref:class I SAM-dependent methyltransferase n=1 Tax=Thermaurantimonas sp. TaxID=2681568 RepID=UPI003919CF8F
MKKVIKRLILKLKYSGNQHECPLCGFKARAFLPGGLHTKRVNAKCPSCGCVERHRILWRYFINIGCVVNEPHKSVLHFAPEPALRRKLTEMLPLYKCSDLSLEDADYAYNLTRVDCPDAHWDYLICFHVLEHIEDDRQAMLEMHRILKPGGVAFVQVPIWPSELHPTYENPTIIDPRDRQITFGQEDHLRIYGLDVVERLQEVGFEVQLVRYTDFFTSDEIHRYALRNTSGISEVFFYCRKHV